MRKLLFYLINRYLTNEERKAIKFGLYSYSDSIGRIKSETCREISIEASVLAYDFKCNIDSSDAIDTMKWLDYYTPVYREQLLVEKDDTIKSYQVKLSEANDVIDKLNKRAKLNHLWNSYCGE